MEKGALSVIPIRETTRSAANLTVARSLQVIGKSRLEVYMPGNAIEYLKDYYRSKEWEIKEVD